MKTAVIGANGYIGKHIVHYLVEQQVVEPICYDIQESFLGNHDVIYYQIDIADKKQLKLIHSDFDIIYFFSGLTGTEISIEKYEDYIQVNEIGFLNCLNFFKNLDKKPKIIFPSTRLVYKGVKNKPLSEDAEKEFKTIYASSKYNGEAYLEIFRNLYSIDYTIFRICVPYANIVGSILSYGTLSFFLDKANKNEPITLFGDGKLYRTFTHVMDVCRQMITVAQMPESSGQCYNIDGETYSLLEIAKLIGNKYKVPVQFTEWPVKAMKLESGDTIFDGTRIRALIPAMPTYSLREWINSLDRQ